MTDCVGCKERDAQIRERDLRIQQLCAEARRIEAERDDYHQALNAMRREAENPK